MMRSRACAIIVSCHNVEDTRGCVGSLAAAEGSPKIIIVDNGPRDSSLQRALEPFDVTMLHPPDNSGFSHGCNLGIRWAMQHTDCEFLLVLHDDTSVRPDTVLLLEGTMDENPDAGLVTGRVLFREDPAKLYYGRGSISWRHGGSRVPSFGTDTMGKRALSRGILRSGPVSYAPECAMLFRRDVLKHLGGLDEVFIMYEEGVDLSLRVSKRGYEIFYCPEAVILHRGHGTHRKDGWFFHDRWSASVPGYDFRIYHMVRNSLINARKHARGSDLVSFATLYPIFAMWKALRASRTLGLRAFHPVWRGLRAGLKEQLLGR